jgi:predicted ATPase
MQLGLSKMAGLPDGRRESMRQPLMVIFEDLHWIDTQTRALLNLLADSIATAQVLLLVNYRPEYPTSS